MRSRGFVSVGVTLAIALLGSSVASARDFSLPNKSTTPGATNPAVSQSDIQSTICVSGWTATIRPKSSYTTALKKKQLSSGYAVNGDQKTGDYEEDHLISLELGGSPDSPKNLWPEPYFGKDGAKIKDKIENKLHGLVCSDAITLKAAQKAIATDWETAYTKYIGPLLTAGSVALSSTHSSQSQGSTSASVVAASALTGATAQCNDGTWSYSQTHSGTCSWHGGVARWLQ